MVLEAAVAKVDQVVEAVLETMAAKVDQVAVPEAAVVNH